VGTYWLAARPTGPRYAGAPMASIWMMCGTAFGFGAEVDHAANGDPNEPKAREAREAPMMGRDDGAAHAGVPFLARRAR